MYPDVVGAYLRWTLLRAALARGWWVVAAVYLVVAADLSSSQLILIGVFQGTTVIVAEVPAGVVADAVSRRLALVLSHVVMGAGMTTTAFFTTFEVLVVSNCLWGLGWALSSGADVAWITDELDRPDLIDRVLTAQARYGLLGTMGGIVSFGVLAGLATLSAAIVVAGLGMIGLGAFVARWPETGFAPLDTDVRLADSRRILSAGFGVARADHVILAMLAATFVINGAAVGFGRLLAQRLVFLGLPTDPDPVVWFAGIALLAAALGALSLRVVEKRIDRRGVARRIYVASCALAAVGLFGFARAPEIISAVAGSLLVSGIGLPIARVAETIVVNRRTSTEVRATVHSFLSQGENLGEIVLGLGLGFLAAVASPTVALTASAALLACAGALISIVQE